MTDNINPKTDYIAKAFKGGSGGKFLTAWLTNAKVDSRFELTSEGASGPCELEFKVDFEQPRPSMIHKNKIRTSIPPHISHSPYFYPTSITKSSELADEVYRIIQITYDSDDVDLIFRL